MIAAVEDLVDDPGAVVSVRLEGAFTSVLVRSVPPQVPPYRPYAEVCATDEVRWVHRPFYGVFVGFRFPDLERSHAGARDLAAPAHAGARDLAAPAHAGARDLAAPAHGGRS